MQQQHVEQSLASILGDSGDLTFEKILNFGGKRCGGALEGRGRRIIDVDDLMRRPRFFYDVKLLLLLARIRDDCHPILISS